MPSKQTVARKSTGVSTLFGAKRTNIFGTKRPNIEQAPQPFEMVNMVWTQKIHFF